MQNSVFGVFLVVILFTLGVFILAGFGIQAMTVVEITPGVFGARMETYSNSDTGISVRYPDDFSVDAEYVYDGLGKEKRISGVSFTIPKEKISGTNLSSDTTVSVEVIPNTPACSARMFIRDSRNVKPLLDGDTGYSFGTMKDHRVGNIYEEQVYALVGSSPCIAVRYFIHSTNIGNYPSGTVTEFNRKDLLLVFDTVRRSVSARVK